MRSWRDRVIVWKFDALANSARNFGRVINGWQNAGTALEVSP
jgi:hypothetical protein